MGIAELDRTDFSMVGWHRQHPVLIVWVGQILSQCASGCGSFFCGSREGERLEIIGALCCNIRIKLSLELAVRRLLVVFSPSHCFN